MTVSIIIPCYNVEKYLEECLCSILSQSFTDFEIIMVDDGSKDRTSEICDSYASEYSFIKVYHIKNSGVSNARNLALTRSLGEYIMFVDPDDIIRPNLLKILYNLIKTTKSDIAYCATKKFSDTISTQVVDGERIPKVRIISPISDFDYCSPAMHATVWGALYHRSILRNLKFDEKLFVAEDSLFFNSAVLKSERLCFVDLELYCYRQRDDSATGRSPYNEKKSTEINSWKEIVKQNDENYPNTALSVSSHCLLGNSAIKGIKFMYRDGGLDAERVNEFVSIARTEWRFAMKAYKSFSSRAKYTLFCIFPSLLGKIYKLFNTRKSTFYN